MLKIIKINGIPYEFDIEDVVEDDDEFDTEYDDYEYDEESDAEYEDDNIEYDDEEDYEYVDEDEEIECFEEGEVFFDEECYTECMEHDPVSYDEGVEYYEEYSDNVVPDDDEANEQCSSFPWTDDDEEKIQRNPFSWSNSMEFDPKTILINYNEKFKDAAPTLFRDEIIRQTLSCMIGMLKPNALLIGAAGVGKTKIVEDIARMIANDDIAIPSQIKGHTIYELPLSGIVAGSNLVGQVESKVKSIIDFATDPENKAILFIDEIHMLKGDSQVYDKIAQLMKPALSRGEMRVIGATTLQESQSLMGDPAFNRRFTRLIVDELSQEQTVDVLKSMRRSLFMHYGEKIKITDKVLEEVVKTADEYKTIGSHRPDNAITLLDRAMADAYIERQTAETVKNKGMFTLEASAVALSKERMKRTAMRIMTGVNERIEPNFESLEESFSFIKGQDRIISELMDIIERDSLNIYPREKPLTLLFAGNSGVGKTEIAKILAHELTNTKPIILNMTEYHSSASINRIIGSPAGYIGSDSKQELPFDILESNPYQVILLDEFEKSDQSVQRLFMSAFEEGVIVTAKGKRIDFSKSIIIATTNAGYTGQGEPMGFKVAPANSAARSIRELSDSFDVELLNRFTKIFDFNPITEPLFKEIMADHYKRDIARIRRNDGFEFLPWELKGEELDRLVKENFTKEFGARPVRKAVQKYIENKVIEKKWR